MNCVKCNGETIVTDTRPIGTRPSRRKTPKEDTGLTSIRRRRKCLLCQYRFSTVESHENIYYSKEKVLQTLKRVQAVLYDCEDLFTIISKLERKEKKA